MNTNTNEPVPGRGLAIASLVLGIVALVAPLSAAVPFSDTLLAIVGLILGINGKRQLAAAGAPTGMATAGIVLCIIALVTTILVFIACVACLGGLVLFSNTW